MSRSASNEPAERLRDELAGMYRGAGYLDLLVAALAAAKDEGVREERDRWLEGRTDERRATVERIRAEADRTWMLPWRKRLYVILDKEAER